MSGLKDKVTKNSYSESKFLRSERMLTCKRIKGRLSSKFKELAVGSVYLQILLFVVIELNRLSCHTVLWDSNHAIAGRQLD